MKAQKKVVLRKKSLRSTRGFALVITLTLMILLTVIAVGLLTLSSISLRTSAQGESIQVARANARMAMLLAIGELQTQTGLDTRVTARADILDKNNPPLLGVWKSWEGTDHETTGNFAGRPISPGNYKSVKDGRFLRWLVSGDPVTLDKSGSLPSTTKTATSVALVGDHTVDPSDAKLQIHLEPVPIQLKDSKGSYAWWISGENQKARLPKPPVKEPATEAEWAAVAKSNSTADPLPFDLEKVLDDPTLADKAIDLKQADLINASSGSSAADKPSYKHFHDLSAVSVGLLTNTATGGWRKDLSLFTENYMDLPSSGLPLFRLTADTTTSCSIPQGSSANYRAEKSILYPWSEYRGTGGERTIYQHGAVASWENLKDYALLYQSLNSPPFTLAARAATNNSSVPAVSYEFLHKVRLLPVIARIQWILSHSAGGPPAPPAGVTYPPGALSPRLLLTPLVTLWNPYSVALNCGGIFRVSLAKPLPCALRYTVNGTTYTNFRSITDSNPAGINYPSKALGSPPVLNYAIASVGSLKPGETRVFSPADATAVAAAAADLPLNPGFRKGGGHYFTVLDDSDQPVVVAPSSSFKADAAFDNDYTDGAQGVGIYLNMNYDSDLVLCYRMVYLPSVATQTYPVLTGLSEAGSLSQVQSAPAPFLSTMFGARLASNTHIPAKGFLQTSPMVNYTAMGDKDIGESTIKHKYFGTNHPVNSPFDYSFVKHSPSGDSYFPNTSGSSGYIVSGFTSGDGLSRCIAAEIPTRPLASLAELQNWDMRYENPIPPYSFNIIGNSDATPLLPANAVVNPGDANMTAYQNLQHDDSYCANHLLFDDWFFSSIAGGNPTGFGSGAGSSLEKNFTDFLTSKTPLINRAYQPILEDAALAKTSAANATSVYSKHVDTPEAWKTIASRLEVEGMFNVNSTSVTAWRALLGHARHQQVPYTTGSGGVALGGAGDYALSRSTIAGDTKAGSGGISGSFSGAAELTGYRELDAKQLDSFAQKIVDQVRDRGPFLSLAEFVNRQLSSGNLALAGTIQAALNEMEKSSSTNIYAGLISALSTGKKYATASPPDAGNAGYQFPLAAEGISVYGIPGWTRQADVLRPLAPVLSARDDTFVIRAYGDARDSNNKILARAVCEVVVRRTRDFCDPVDAAELATPPTQPLNKTFGRRYQMVSFRWLAAPEI